MDFRLTDKLQRVMNSAARVIQQHSESRKFDSGLSRLLHDELHWLDVADRVQFKRPKPSSALLRSAPLTVTVHRSQSHMLYQWSINGIQYSQSEVQVPRNSNFYHLLNILCLHLRRPRIFNVFDHR